MKMKIQTDHSRIKVSFRKAKFGANKRKPGVGECTWLDRAFRKNESSHFFYKKKSGITNDPSVLYAIMLYPNGRIVPVWRKKYKAAYFTEAILKRRIFYLQVKYSKRYGRIVTRVGPP